MKTKTAPYVVAEHRPSAARMIWASALAVVAVVLAGVSARHVYSAYAPPVEVYDNERMVVAVFYAVIALMSGCASLAIGWSGRAAVLRGARLFAMLAIAYVAVLMVWWAS